MLCIVWFKVLPPFVFWYRFCCPSHSVTSLLCPHPECQSPSVCCCCLIPSVLFQFSIHHFYFWFRFTQVFAAPSQCFYHSLSFRVMFSRLLQEIASSQKPAHVPLLYFTACLLPYYTKQLSDMPAIALSVILRLLCSAFESSFSSFIHSLFFPDGIHSISAQCILRVLIITEDMLGSSVTVRLQNMSQEHFLSPLLGNFLEGVSAVLSVPVEDVFIFNIQPDLDAAPGRILNVSFSAALPGGLFFPSEALEEQLYLNRPRLTSLTQMEVSSQLHNRSKKKKFLVMWGCT